MADPGKFSRLTPGVTAEPLPARQDGAQDAVALSTSAAGVRFRLVDDGPHGPAYGPAPWCLGSYNTAALAVIGGFCPRPGDRCVVVFAGAGTGTPWVLAWFR